MTTIKTLALIENLKDIQKALIKSHMNYEKELLIIYTKIDKLKKELQP